METVLIVVVVLHAATLGVLIWALLQANKKKRELEGQLEPILSLAECWRSAEPSEGIARAKKGLDLLLAAANTLKGDLSPENWSGVK